MFAASRSDNGGDHRGMGDLHDRWRAVAETFAGMGLFSMPWWSHLLEGVVVGSQAIAAICGAAIGISGVYRLFVSKHRRKSDDGTSNARRQGS